MKRRFALSTVALLGALQVWQWRHWQTPLPDLAAPPPAPPQPPIDAPPPPPPRAHYDAVLERPLFRPDRRPAPPPTTPDPNTARAAPALERLTLTSVLITPEQRVAWVRVAEAGRSGQRIEVGDQMADWTVAAIHPDHILLERQGQIDRLPLRDFTRPGAPSATPLIPPAPDPTPRP
ncbi:type II secretion system protein N [Marichromatium bheemlicum]|uniref:Type II secretion system protein GspC N-terminal domain-containing protein n=1 Tax=Marichromatium bheemlicum TaxID=365339 RepID=A0ABX1I5G9_9GAMM|nr:type II secretion system protein N [Marichromatium bheemlicum]NKN32829.1 hypothetical protein [Marichromatium bheemlicum]